MKIGILTLPIAENYGGILQAVALCQLLEQEGHDVTLIYKDTVNKKWKEVVKSILRLVPGHDLFNVHTKQKIMKDRLERVKLHKYFIDKEISKISPVLYTNQDLMSYAEEAKFDAVIVGSDQVWRKAYINDQYYRTQIVKSHSEFNSDKQELIDEMEEYKEALHMLHHLGVKFGKGKMIIKKFMSY